MAAMDARHWTQAPTPSGGGIKRHPLGIKSDPKACSSEQRAMRFRSVRLPSHDEIISSLRANCHAAVRKRRHELMNKLRETYDLDDSVSEDSQDLGHSTTVLPTSHMRESAGVTSQAGDMTTDIPQNTPSLSNRYSLYTMKNAHLYRKNMLMQLSTILQDEQESQRHALQYDQVGEREHKVEKNENARSRSSPHTNWESADELDEAAAAAEDEYRIRFGSHTSPLRPTKTESQGHPGSSLSPQRNFRFHDLSADEYASIMRSMHQELVSGGNDARHSDTDLAYETEAEQAVCDTDEVAALLRDEEEELEFERAARDLYEAERLMWEAELEIRQQIDDAEQHEHEEDFVRELNLDPQSVAEISALMSEWL